MLPIRELQIANEIYQERLRQAEQFRLQLIAKAATKAKAKKKWEIHDFFPLYERSL